MANRAPLFHFLLSYILWQMNLEKAFLKLNTIIFGFVFLRVGNRETAEDIVQEVFLKAWRSRETFDPKKSSLKTWLFTIAINDIKDYLKSKKETVDLSKIEENVGDESVDIPNQTEQKNLIEIVFEKLSLLSDRDQELILLRFKSDMSVKDIAKVLGMEYVATKVALHRAMEKLSDLCNKNQCNL